MTCKKTSKKSKFLCGLLSVLMVFSLIVPVTSYATMPVGAAKVQIKTTKQANDLLSQGASRGIDVSKWQGNINWQKVATENVDFAFIRSSYGTDTDAYFVKNAQGANANGIAVGAYHYARFKDTASMQKEAQFFISQLKKVKITYPVALDLENHYGLSKAKLTSLALEFIKIVEAEGYNVMLYSYQNFITGRLDRSQLTNTKMWVANYQKYPDGIKHQIWQHTSYGTVSGISGRVDINISYLGATPKQQKTVQVDRNISQEVKTFLNTNYDGRIALEGTVDMKEMNKTLHGAIQRELNYYYGQDNGENGNITMKDIDSILQVDFSSDAGAAILKLIQCKLVYTGLYNHTASGVYDKDTQQALLNYQETNKLAQTGNINRETLCKLFGVATNSKAEEPNDFPEMDQ